MGDGSSIYVLLAGLLAALINSISNARIAKDAGDRAERGEDKKYMRERLKERDQILLEPLRQEIAHLLAFKQAVGHYYLVASAIQSPFDDEVIESAKASLIEVSGVAYSYENILDPLISFHEDSGNNVKDFKKIKVEVEKVLDEKRDELSRLLTTSQFQPADPEQVTKRDSDDGPLVNAMRWVERRIRKWWP